MPKGSLLTQKETADISAALKKYGVDVLAKTAGIETLTVNKCALGQPVMRTSAKLIFMAIDELKKGKHKAEKKVEKKSPAKPVAKKSPAKKSPAKKSPAKKSPAKKSPAKPAAKKSPAKSPAKKPAEKKPAEKKPAAKKSPAKKPAVKIIPSEGNGLAPAEENP